MVHEATKDLDTPVRVETSDNIDTTSLTRYLTSKIPDLYGDVAIYRFLGGHSNLTYLAKSGDREFVLKVEPPGKKAKSAHDMSREFRMLQIVAPHYSLAPDPVLLCDDETILGGVFCVMRRIKGHVVRSEDSGIAADIESGCMASRFAKLVSAIAELHLLDVEKIGLTKAGKPETYRTRQTEGWCRRFRSALTDDADPADDVISWLYNNQPSSPQMVSVIHNDFKMDNMVWDEEVGDTLVGVLDWEMSTVGDPLMDLACMLSFWIEERDSSELRSLRAMPSDFPGILTREEVLQSYIALTRSDVGCGRFYRCFGLFRRAAIEQQKYFRYKTGHSTDARFSNLDDAVRILLANCRKEMRG